ncbi:MAG TPA: hypothetical protein VMU06_11495 [Stellaceae bacterium]|nr:hypothetical protein [Stellaceae bacterium]
MIPIPIRVSAAKSTLAVILQIAAVLFVIGIAAHAARAQQAGPQPAQAASNAQGEEILLTPYLWTPWMTTSIHPYRPDLHGQTDTIDTYQLLSHLTWVPFMGTAEYRNGPFGVFVDFLHAPLKAGVNTRDLAFGGATSGFTMNEGTALVLLRPLADPMQQLDLGVGARAWGFNGDVVLNQERLPSFTATKGDSWVDPILALRYRHALGDGFSATFYGDVGGFGAGAKIDWQAVATLDYASTPKTDIHLGFRALNFDYSAEKAKFNVHMYGPLLAATFHLGPY